MQFEISDRVFLKISPWKGVLRFGKRGKLSPRYIGPYEILSKVGPVQLKENLANEETPVQIVDRKEQVLRSKVIPLVKVLWKNHEREVATWEPEVQMHRQYPQLFSY